jgi:hypothetical protein
VALRKKKLSFRKLQASRRSKNVVRRVRKKSRSIVLLAENERKNIPFVRTRKANSMQTAIQGRIGTLGATDKRQAALELRLQGVAEHDIAVALKVSQPRVSQLLKEVLTEKTEAIREMGEDLRTLELERCDRMIFHWYLPAQKDARSADVLIKWVERRHKISGMEISRSDIRVTEGLKVGAGSFDLAKLAEHPDAERLFRNMEELQRIAGPQLPEDENEAPRKKNGRLIEHKEEDE